MKWLLTGQIGMEAFLPEMVVSPGNVQKTAGLRLIRTAICELVGSGAKDPHGIPKYYKAHLDPGEKITFLCLSTTVSISSLKLHLPCIITDTN